MPSPSRLLLALFVAGAPAVAVAAAACSNPDTASDGDVCKPNVGENGISQDPNGCDQFAVCTLPKTTDCCVDADGGALAGDELAKCLHGYGDPSCAYLDIKVDPMDPTKVSYTCMTMPPAGTPDGGSPDGG
jgi:hypothetical protein